MQRLHSLKNAHCWSSEAHEVTASRWSNRSDCVVQPRLICNPFSHMALHVCAIILHFTCSRRMRAPKRKAHVIWKTNLATLEEKLLFFDGLQRRRLHLDRHHHNPSAAGCEATWNFAKVARSLPRQA